MLRKSLVVLILMIVAGLARADVGSVISSFRVPGEYGSSVDVVYRDTNRVYCIVWYWVAPQQCYTELQCFTTAGSRVFRKTFDGSPIFRDGDRCHLGSGYIAALNGLDLKYLVKGTGSVVASYRVSGGGGAPPVNLSWDGAYYVVGAGATRGDFRRFTPYGAYAGAWSSMGWPPGLTGCLGTTISHRANGVAGRFLIVTSYHRNEPCGIINMWNGKVGTTWRNPAVIYRSACYGDSSRPAQYGGAVWLGAQRTDESLWVYEVDIEARGGAPVVPTSVGKVKAIYR